MQKFVSGVCKMQVQARKGREFLTSLMAGQFILFGVDNDRKRLHLVLQNFMGHGVLGECTTHTYTEQSKSPAE